MSSRYSYQLRRIDTTNHVDVLLAQLLTNGVFIPDFEIMKAALEPGGNVNGPPELPYAPIVAAIMANHAGIVHYFLERGADLDRPVVGKIPGRFSEKPIAMPGERALHVAARIGNVEILGLLLKRSRAGVNATDDRGYTPLRVSCGCQYVRVEVTRLLLQAGADPALADQDGFTALHYVALCEDMDVFDMLYSYTSATLNCRTNDGQTPLFVACFQGNERLVSKLLSLGAKQPMPVDNSDVCPLSIAVCQGLIGVVRVLLNEGGITAIGGRTVLPRALHSSVRFRKARVLQLLLAVDGQERRSEWANNNNNSDLEGVPLLHYGASYTSPAEVSVLLEAGADETARDTWDRLPLEVVGICRAEEDKRQVDRWDEVAIRRMLQRGPAYRARLWAWPSDEEAEAGGSGDGDTAGAGAGAVLSPPPVVKTPPVAGVRMFRPKGKNGSKVFVGLIGRYCAKA